MKSCTVIIRIFTVAAMLAGLAGGFLGGNIATSGDARADWFKVYGTYPGCGWNAELGISTCGTLTASCEAIATYRLARLTGIKPNGANAMCYYNVYPYQDATTSFCPSGYTRTPSVESGCIPWETYGEFGGGGGSGSGGPSGVGGKSVV